MWKLRDYTGQHLLTSVERPWDTLWFLHKVELFKFCFYIALTWYFKLEIIYEIASLFNLKEKKIDLKGKKIRTQDLNCHYTTSTNH